MKPVTPTEVKRNFVLPDIAISIINKKIINHFTGYESIINKLDLSLDLSTAGFCNDVVANILAKIPKIYIQYGWDVQDVNDCFFVFQELNN